MIERILQRKRSKRVNRHLIIAAKLLLVCLFVIAALLILKFPAFKKQYSFIRCEHYINKAKKSLEKNRLTAARIMLQNAYRHNPEKTEILDLFIEILKREGSQEILGLLIQKYLKSPDIESARLLLQTAINRNQQPLVLPFLEDILERFPNDAMTLRLVGIVFLGVQQYREAEKNLKKALILDPNNLLLKLDLATLHLAHTDPSKATRAREFLEDVRKIPDYYLVATRSLAAHTRITNPVDGLGLYEEILEKHPDDWKSRIRAFQIRCSINISQAKERLTDLWSRARDISEKTEFLSTVLAYFGAEEAVEWCKKLEEDELTVPHINLLRIGALWQLERYLEALKLANDGQIHAATSLEKTLLIIWAYRCQVALKQDTAASRSIESLRQMALHDQRIAMVVANQLVALGQEDLGVIFLEIAASGSDANLAQTALNALFLYFKKKADTKNLLRVHEAILKIQPENPFVQNNLAVLLVLTKSDPERAAKLAESAYISAPSNPVIVNTYAHTLATMSRVEEALKLIETIHPDHFTESMKLYRAHVLFLSGKKQEAASLVANIESKEFLDEEKDILNKILASSGLQSSKNSTKYNRP